jgi:phosphoglycolate phosphatase-like HAD superfamily hydrolase
MVDFHDQSSHDEVQLMVDEVNLWFDSDAGKAYREWSEDKRHPHLVSHLMMDTATETPEDVLIGLSTVFMLGAMSMRRWMEAKSAARD